MNGSETNGDANLLAQVVEAARELSSMDDPAAVMRLAQKHSRQIIRFDRSLAASRRELSPPQIRITRSDAPGMRFHDPTGHEEFPVITGGLLADLLYAGQATLIDDVVVGPSDPSAEYLAGMRSIAAIPQFRGGEPVDMVFHLCRDPHAF